jgi:hypothetical protein
MNYIEKAPGSLNISMPLMGGKTPLNLMLEFISKIF